MSLWWKSSVGPPCTLSPCTVLYGTCYCATEIAKGRALSAFNHSTLLSNDWPITLASALCFGVRHACPFWEAWAWTLKRFELHGKTVQGHWWRHICTNDWWRMRTHLLYIHMPFTELLLSFEHDCERRVFVTLCRTYTYSSCLLRRV